MLYVRNSNWIGRGKWRGMDGKRVAIKEATREEAEVRGLERLEGGGEEKSRREEDRTDRRGE